MNIAPAIQTGQWWLCSRFQKVAFVIQAQSRLVNHILLYNYIGDEENRLDVLGVYPLFGSNFYESNISVCPDGSLEILLYETPEGEEIGESRPKVLEILRKFGDYGNEPLNIVN